MDRKETINADPEVMAGKPVIADTRLTAELIWDLIVYLLSTSGEPLKSSTE